jgi:hypothetical protein
VAFCISWRHCPPSFRPVIWSEVAPSEAEGNGVERSLAAPQTPGERCRSHTLCSGDRLSERQIELFRRRTPTPRILGRARRLVVPLRLLKPTALQRPRFALDAAAGHEYLRRQSWKTAYLRDKENCASRSLRQCLPYISRISNRVGASGHFYGFFFCRGISGIGKRASE